MSKKTTNAWCAGWVAGWNAQAEIKERTCQYKYSAADDRHHCSECGQRLVFKMEFMHYCPNCGAKVVE